MSKFTGEYPADWPQKSLAVKERAGWRCERCDHVDDASTGHALTVHHLDNDKSNCRDWNLAALCQRCHLHIQGKVNMAQSWMFDHSDWMRPHVKGYEEWVKGGESDTFRATQGIET